jgi:hypothetical protein
VSNFIPLIMSKMKPVVTQKTDGTGDDVFSGMKEVFGLAPNVPQEETVVSPDGWLEPDSRIVDTVQSIVDAIDHGTEPRCSGRDQQQAFEITVALRESARRGHAPVHPALLARHSQRLPRTRTSFDARS